MPLSMRRPPKLSKRPMGRGRSDEVPAWSKIYEGLGDEEIDRLDAAIRQRADLTRSPDRLKDWRRSARIPTGRGQRAQRSHLLTEVGSCERP